MPSSALFVGFLAVFPSFPYRASAAAVKDVVQLKERQQPNAFCIYDEWLQAARANTDVPAYCSSFIGVPNVTSTVYAGTALV